MTAEQPEIVTVAEREERPMLVLQGCVDLFAIDALYQAADGLLERGDDVSVCCEKTEYLGTAGLQVLLALKKALGEKGKTLQMVAPSPQVEKLLALTGLTGAFT